MSIEKMKLFSVVGREETMETVTRTLLATGGVHFEDATRAIGPLASEVSASNQKNPYEKPLERIEYFFTTTGLAPQVKEAAPKVDLDSISHRTEDILAKLTELQSHIGAVQQTVVDKRNILMELEHLRVLNINLDDLFTLKHYIFRFGHMTREKYERLLKYDNTNFAYFATVVGEEMVWLMYLTPRANKDVVDLLFSKLDFERVWISEEAHGTPAEAYEGFSKTAGDNEAEIDRLTKQKSLIADENLLFFSTAYSTVKFAFEAFEIRKYASILSRSFCLSGWVPASRLQEISEAISKIDQTTFTVEEVKEVPITPPTKLHNNFFSRPFEQFVRMYGVPIYNEIDPTLLISLSYTVFFGIMFGDLGQGFLLAVLGLLYAKFFNKKSGQILASLGISSMIFGTLYGSVFGFEDIFQGVISPVRNTNMILGTAIGIGMCMITIAMILNMINGIRQKNYVKMLFGSNGVAGLVLYWAVVWWAISFLILNKNVMSLSYGLLAMLLPFLIIFFSHPLDSLLAHRRASHNEKASDFFVNSFFEGFETVLSYLSNTVSFIRIGAFVLCHAAMMMAVMVLGGIAGGHIGVTAIITLIIGNLFVVGFEGLVVGIQVLRLEYFEMFSRFYGGTGKEYAPATTQIIQEKQ